LCSFSPNKPLLRYSILHPPASLLIREHHPTVSPCSKYALKCSLC
jgi:hypothetical protein